MVTPSNHPKLDHFRVETIPTVKQNHKNEDSHSSPRVSGMFVHHDPVTRSDCKK